MYRVSRLDSVAIYQKRKSSELGKRRPLVQCAACSVFSGKWCLGDRFVTRVRGECLF